MRSSRARESSSTPSLALLMVSMFACFYTAGRLWQDAEMRYRLLGNLPSHRFEAKESISVDDTLKLLDCKEQQKKLVDAEQELAAAKSHGYISKFEHSSNKSQLQAVIGIMTTFGGQPRRASSRKSWLPTGSALKKFEDEKRIIIRFVIGRSPNKGDMSDRQIDQESSDFNDFLILDDHVESDDDLTHKTKLYFTKAVETWEAAYYLKVDDNIAFGIDQLMTMLNSHLDKPRAYVGCMKAGEVISDPNAQWYEPDWWKFGDQKSEYHRHAAGQAYALSKPLAQYISINSAYLKEYKNEDVAVGSWMIGLDTEHVDNQNLCCGANNERSLDSLKEMTSAIIIIYQLDNLSTNQSCCSTQSLQPRVILKKVESWVTLLSQQQQFSFVRDRM